MAQVKLKEAVGRKSRTIVSHCETGTKCVVTAGSHTIVTDEPPERGGHDEGAPPLFHLTTALATCQTVQIRKAAEAMRFNHGAIDVVCTTTTDRIPGIDGNDPVMRFVAAEMTIDIETDEPPKRLERLKALSEDMCPVGVLFDDAGAAVEIAWNAKPMKV